MYKNEDVNVSMAVPMWILEAELEIRQVSLPCPILSDKEPGQKKKVQNRISKPRSI